jgi:hypothetical protein
MKIHPVGAKLSPVDGQGHMTKFTILQMCLKNKEYYQSKCNFYYCRIMSPMTYFRVPFAHQKECRMFSKSHTAGDICVQKNSYFQVFTISLYLSAYGLSLYLVHYNYLYYIFITDIHQYVYLTERKTWITYH